MPAKGFKKNEPFAGFIRRERIRKEQEELAELQKAYSWNAQRGPQTAFLESEAEVFELLYGGAAGGGKSDALIAEASRYIDQKDYKAIIFRRTYPELEKSLVPKAFEMFHGKAKPTNKGMEWRFPSGAVVYFAHLQREEDKEKHKSAEYDFIGFDELTSFTETQYVYLFSRCRGKNPNITRKVRSGSNPTGIGNAWVKARFIDIKDQPELAVPYATMEYEYACGWRVGTKVYTSFNDLPEGYQHGSPEFSNEEYVIYKEKKSGLTRAFIPALLWGNERLIKADPDYISRLKALDEKQQKALLYGHWDVFEGQFFSEWDPDHHVVDAFDIPASWKKFVAIDYGYGAPFCALWFAIDNDGKVFCYRELYGTKISPEDQAKQVLMLSGDESIDWFAADPSMFSKHGYGESFAQIYDRHGLVLIPSNNSRPVGWALVHDFLANGNIAFFKNCRNVIRTLPTLNHSRRNPDDLDTMQEDHAVDALRYFLLTLKGEKSQQRTATGDAIPDWWKAVQATARLQRKTLRVRL